MGFSTSFQASEGFGQIFLYYAITMGFNHCRCLHSTMVPWWACTSVVNAGGRVWKRISEDHALPTFPNVKAWPKPSGILASHYNPNCNGQHPCIYKTWAVHVHCSKAPQWLHSTAHQSKPRNSMESTKPDHFKSMKLQASGTMKRWK